MHDRRIRANSEAREPEFDGNRLVEEPTKRGHNSHTRVSSMNCCFGEMWWQMPAEMRVGATQRNGVCAEGAG